MNNKKDIPLYIALLPIAFLLMIISYTVIIAKLPVHFPVFASAMFAALVAKVLLKCNWKDLESGISDTLKMVVIPIMILLVIGMSIGTWILSGVVPTMIYYGLKMITPDIFLPVALISSSLISISTGSSWTTMSTIGIALIGMGEGLGIPREIIVGAVLSGAYFGDKMSPLSDTTNLAPLMAGAKLFDHIKHMLYTTVPAYILALIGFIILGNKYSNAIVDDIGVDLMLTTLNQNFTITPWLILIPILTIGLVMKKVPALPGLFSGALLGGIAAMLIQKKALIDVMRVLQFGYKSDTGVKAIDSLLTRGGMASMLMTISLIISALAFAGIMEKSGMLDKLAATISKVANTKNKIVVASVITPILTNLCAGGQYMSIVITGRMFRKNYEELNLAPKNLSRALEDGGTITSPLVPWTVCGAFVASTFGVPTYVYAPFCLFNLICPVISIFYGIFGITIEENSNLIESVFENEEIEEIISENN
ncbi:Na+/H+ antiporter NhaC [Cetobacterium somerae]|uniref:Na+/H+ antiporter NhaC n=1 Tax=Cetobacterium somerae TaxID=188913 RepID=UPI00211E4CFB|nr:Na+/H+ antiporter NhaC [Cetobacterium somerae]MCQ9627759.1 Na+/H+ antiporter NhaC [Cetobacterium somerae]